MIRFGSSTRVPARSGASAPGCTSPTATRVMVVAPALPYSHRGTASLALTRRTPPPPPAAGCPSGSLARGPRAAAAAGILRCSSSSSGDSAAQAAGTDPRVVVVYDFSDQVVDYEQAWAWQRALVERAASAASRGLRRRRHALLLLQHPPVYTLGAGSTTDNLRFPPGSPPIPLHRTERGGEVTYHGPGQLVMYPILDLQGLNPDLHWYLRQLEQVVIEALDAVSGLQGKRLEGLTGVWVDGAKVAAIGVRAKKWVSYHGLAVNVVNDLSPFSRIVPCGISDRPVTSVQRLMEQQIAEADPFAPPPLAGAGAGLEGVAAAAAAGAEGPDGDGMIPLAEASQEVLRRMLAATGMTPPILEEAGPGGAAAAAAARTDLSLDDPDDPFAPPQPPPQQQQPQLPSAQYPGASPDGHGSGPGRGAAPAPESTGAPGALQAAAAAGESGAAAQLTVRSRWTEAESRLLREYSVALLEAFSQVFGVELVAGDPGELV